MVVRCACGTKVRLDPGRLNAEAQCRCGAPVSPLARPWTVSRAEELAEVIARAPLPVVVDFWAGWCGPCVMVAPEVEKLASAMAGRAVIAKVNTEDLPAVSAAHGVRGIPTFVLFRGGRETKRFSGALPAESIAEVLGLGRP